VPNQIGKRSSSAAADTTGQPAAASPSAVGKRTLADRLGAMVQRRGVGEASAAASDGRTSDPATPGPTPPRHGMIHRVFGRRDVATGTGQPGDIAPDAEEPRLSDLDAQVCEQIVRVKEQVRTELGHYEEISRVIAQEAAAGRLQLSSADYQRFAAMNQELEDVAELLEIPLATGVSDQLAAVDLVQGMDEAKRRGNELMDVHASIILPRVREMDALNFLVQNRLQRLGDGYQNEVDDANRFVSSHELSVGVSESLAPDHSATLGTLRQEVKQARVETQIESNMLRVLGSALLGEAQAKVDVEDVRMRNVVSTKKTSGRRTEQSAARRRTEIEGKFGDLYEATAEGGTLGMHLRPEAVGSVSILDLENRMDATLAADKPRFMARAVRAAVAANPDFERVEQRRLLGKSRESVVLAPDTFSRLNPAESVSGPVLAPRERMLQAGLSADRASRLNDLKFSLTRDAREAIDAEFDKSQRWLNTTRDLTLEKVQLLWRTMDAIVGCQSADAMLRVINEAQREHGQLWRERGMLNGGQTSQTLERWAEAVQRFLAPASVAAPRAVREQAHVADEELGASEAPSHEPAHAGDSTVASAADPAPPVDRQDPAPSDIGTLVRPLDEERLDVTYLNLADQVHVQRDRVVRRAQIELNCYREVSRVIAQETAAGRLQLSAADAARASKLAQDLDELAVVLRQPPAGDVNGHGKWSVDLLTRAEFAKQQGNELVDAHAEAILPLVRDIETLNELVQIRLDRVAKGYKDELESAQRFQATHRSGIGLSPSLQPDLRATYTALRQDVELARAETTVETQMLHLLGAALIAQVEASSDTPGNHLLRRFSSSAANQRRADASATQHKQEIEAKFGDVYDARTAGGAVDLTLKPVGVGSMSLLDLEDRMEQTLAADDPAYMADAVRAAVAANPDFEHDTTEQPFSKPRERVMIAPDTYQRLYAERGGPGLPAPRERLVNAGLAANRASKLNALKFSLTSDARETIDTMHRKWDGWSNLRTELTHQKMLLLIRTMDAIILCQTPDSLLQVIQQAEQEHAQLLRRWLKKDGGTTARALERWAEAVRTFMS